MRLDYTLQYYQRSPIDTTETDEPYTIVKMAVATVTIAIATIATAIATVAAGVQTVTSAVVTIKMTVATHHISMILTLYLFNF